MRTHELKTWPSFFTAILERRKTFEVRRNDRDFAVGDRLVLKEYDPSPLNRKFVGFTGGEYTGRALGADVTYVMQGGNFGLDPDYVVLGIRLKDGE